MLTALEPTRLDLYAAFLPDVLARLAADPHGDTAKDVRDDLRRAHPVGVRRNRGAVAKLVNALPPDYRRGLLSERSRNAATYRRMIRCTCRKG